MAKSAKKKGAAKSTSTTSITTSPQTSDVPKPWATAPSALEPFLSNLEQDHFYIVSVDNHDKAFKKRLFSVPLLLNIFLTIAVIYRAYTALPFYLDIFTQLLGHETANKVDIREQPRSEVFQSWLKRALTFLGDFILSRFVAKWPLEFFLGRNILGEEREAGPVSWRRAVTFQGQEVVVRKSRKWDHDIFQRETATGSGPRNTIEEVLASGSEMLLLRARIDPVVSRRFIQQKTGYQMLDRNWELYFSGMIEAHALIEDKTSKFDDFRTAVIVYAERWGWLIWEVWKDHEHGAGSQDSQKLQEIKNALTALGKENLFFRTIEVIQSQRSAPGPFTTERRDQAVRKIREEFEEQKLDFAHFWNMVGGIQNLPGLEIST